MRVEAIPTGIGAFGSSIATVDIDYIPASLDFYVKTENDAGFVEVTIGFYNNEDLFNEFTWTNSDTISEWTYVSIPMVQNEPVLTHAEIEVSALVGDFSPGMAKIWVDNMGFDGTTNTDERLGEEELHIFPNPAVNKINFRKNQSQSDRLQIFSANGELRIEKSFNQNLQEIDLTGFSAGVYYYRLFSSEKVSSSGKFLVVK
jgi:hypothetical protein